jgi:uncharacterized membrane protein
LFGVVVDIVLLRRGPEHLPASPVLLGIVCALYAIVTAVVVHVVATPEPGWPWALALAIVGMLLWYRVALNLAQKRERFLQMMTGIFIIRVIAAPVLTPMATSLMIQMQANQSPPPLLQLVFVAAFAWWLAANARVVKSAFEWPWFGAILMVMAQEIALLILASLLFGKAAAA